MITASMLVDWTLRSGILLGGAALVIASWRSASAAQRHAIWVTAMIAVSCLPFLISNLPKWNLIPSFPLKTEVELIDSVPVTSLPTVAMDLPGNGVIPSMQARWQPTWAPALFFLWSFGSAIQTFRLVRGHWKLSSLAKQARQMTTGSNQPLKMLAEKGISVRFTQQHSPPLVYGLLRPRVLLPAEASEWPADRLKAVLAHELAHIERGDLLWNWLSTTLRILQWWNPMIHLAANRLQYECERACDDVVLRQGMPASDYATHLLDVATNIRTSVPRAGTTMARGLAIETRLKSLLDEHQSRKPITGKGLLLMIAIVTPVVILLATAGMAETQGTQPPNFILKTLGDEGIRVESQSTTFDSKTETITFGGDVIVNYEDWRLRGDLLEIESSKSGILSSMIATGTPVTITGSDSTGRSLTATCRKVTFKDDQFLLSGDPEIHHENGGTFRAPSMRYTPGTGNFVMEGPSTYLSPEGR